jgi:hypothetical protein
MVVATLFVDWLYTPLILSVVCRSHRWVVDKDNKRPRVPILILWTLCELSILT